MMPTGKIPESKLNAAGISAHITVEPAKSTDGPSLRVTRQATVIAFVAFFLNVGLSPTPGSSLTWCVMLCAAFIAFLGYFAARNRKEPISAFYLIYPMMLFVALLFFMGLNDIVHAILRYQGDIK